MKKIFTSGSFSAFSFVKVSVLLLLSTFAFGAKYSFSSEMNKKFTPPTADTVDLSISGYSNVDSILTGANFIYTLNYSVSSLTANGENVKIQLTLPQNMSVSGGTAGIAYDHSQVSSVSISGSLVTVTLINPIPAGSTGQLQLSLVYPNGTTPNGYNPPIVAQMSATNGVVSPVVSNISYVVAEASNSINLTKTANTTNGTVDHYFTYTIAYSNTGGSTGNLNLYNAQIVDTLPPGTIFITAGKFGSIPYTYDAVNNVVSWNWGSSTFSGSGSTTITIEYDSSVYNNSSVVSNCATVTGNIPVLPIGTTAAAPPITGCASGSLHTPSEGGSTSGSGISDVPGLCSGMVMAGTTATFTEGWTNSGSTNLDSIVITYAIDTNITVNTIVANYVKDPVLTSNPPNLLIYKEYATNLHPAYTVIGPYNNIDIYNKVSPSVDTISLAAGEYITKVKILVQSTPTGKILPGMSEDLTYKGIIRTTSQGSNGGGTIIEGSGNFTNCSVTPTGTKVNNCYTGDVYLNSTSIPLSSCGTAHIIAPAPVMSSLLKSILNSSTSFSPGDTVQYELRFYQLGIGTAQNVIWTDSLDARLTYLTGSALFKIGNGGTWDTVSNVTQNGAKVLFNLDTIPQGDSVWMKFSARIADGTAPGNITNFATLSSSNSYINSGSPKTSSVTATVISAAAYTSKLGQNGCDTTTYVYYPTNADATPEGKIHYRLSIKNTGNVGAKNLTIVDVFPYIGDNRGSQYFANLLAPITFSDHSSTVYYDTVSNPCLTDFNPAINGAGCSPANWSTTPPANITAVKAIKITRSATLAPLDSLIYTWPMVLPVGVPQNIVMYNSFTYQLSRADNNSQLLPATPNKVGMITDCISPLGSLGNYVWVDSNANGLQDESPSAGLNGVKVYLYSAGANGQIGGGDDVLLDSTLTATAFNGQPGYYSFPNLASGSYYVVFPDSLVGYHLTVANQTNQVDSNSDANQSGYSEVVVINAAGTGLDKDNPTIDAGYIPCLNSVSAVIKNVTCYGAGNGSITLTPTGNDGPISYSWSDGVTSENRTGLSGDSLTVNVTDSLGCSIRKNYVVKEPTAIPIGLIKGNPIVCLDTTGTFIDTIAGGKWSISDTSIATVDSLTGIVTPVIPGVDTLTYTIVSGACSVTSTLSITVQDCSGGVNSGNGGGLESKSLGDAIAKRVYNKAKNNISNTVSYNASSQLSNLTVNSIGGSGISLSTLLPASLNYTNATYNETPADILGLSNAVDVKSLDYTSSGICKAVSFGTKTLGDVYSHTKPVCDRLKAAQLLYVEPVNIGGYNFIKYKLLQNDGTTEYAISFNAGKSSGSGYSLQSDWLNTTYQNLDTMYNFELWASNSLLLQNMASTIISNLESAGQLQQINPALSDLPLSYVSSGRRILTNLDLNITNGTANTTGYFQIQEQANELSTTTTTRNVPFTIAANGQSSVSIPSSDTYVSNVYMYLNGKETDVVFMSDGPWSYSYDSTTNTKVSLYNVTNDPSRNVSDSEYPLFRNIALNATTSSYVSVFKLLRGGGIADDISGYKGLKFNCNAAGASRIQITLVKQSITNWADQYTLSVPVQSGNAEYDLSLNSFTSTASQNKINANDVTTVAVSYIVNGSSSIATTLSNVSFTKQDVGYLKSLQSKDITVYPNPSSGKFTCSFMSDTVQTVTVKVIEIASGKVVFSQPVAVIVGTNNVPVEFTVPNNGAKLYAVAVDGDNVKYNRQTILIDKK